MFTVKEFICLIICIISMLVVCYINDPNDTLMEDKDYAMLSSEDN
jgi:major membrane immunogen (membrane-anchored lipoprotein)